MEEKEIINRLLGKEEDKIKEMENKVKEMEKELTGIKVTIFIIGMIFLGYVLIGTCIINTIQ